MPTRALAHALGLLMRSRSMPCPGPHALGLLISPALSATSWEPPMVDHLQDLTLPPTLNGPDPSPRQSRKHSSIPFMALPGPKFEYF